MDYSRVCTQPWSFSRISDVMGRKFHRWKREGMRENCAMHPGNAEHYSESLREVGCRAWRGRGGGRSFILNSQSGGETKQTQFRRGVREDRSSLIVSHWVLWSLDVHEYKFSTRVHPLRSVFSLNVWSIHRLLAKHQLTDPKPGEPSFPATRR